MNDNPLISIVIPVYKVEKYVGKCIESVIAQTFDDWELLLIDDGSPDSSGDICDHYAETDHRIRVFHIPNGGVSAARNLGIDNARGRWITFIDSDDWVEPEYLADFMKRNPTPKSIVVSGLKTHTPQRIYESFRYEDHSTVNGVKASNLIVVCDLFRDGGPVNKLFDLNLIKQNNLKFRRDLSFHEDHIFVYSYYLLIENIITSRYCGYHYMYYGEQSKDSLSRLGKKNINGLLKTSDIFLDLMPKLFGYFNISDNEYQSKAITLTGYSQRILAIYNACFISDDRTYKIVLKNERSNIRIIRKKYYNPSLKRRVFMFLASLPLGLGRFSIGSIRCIFNLLK